MAVSYVGYGTTAAASNNDVTPGLPTRQAGDLLVAVTSLRSRTATSYVASGSGWTRRCVALDTWAASGHSVAAQLATLGEGECGHIWWTPRPLPDGFWPACRSVDECERLDVAGILRAQPGATVLLLNEPNNPDTAGGGWPVAPEVAALRLGRVVDELRRSGLSPACCGVYLDASDSLGGVRWMQRYIAAGGGSDVVHYHVFGRTADEARRIMRTAEKAWPGELAVSEAGWCEAVKDEVRRTDSPRYRAVFTLKRFHCW